MKSGYGTLKPISSPNGDDDESIDYYRIVTDESDLFTLNIRCANRTINLLSPKSLIFIGLIKLLVIATAVVFVYSNGDINNYFTSGLYVFSWEKTVDNTLTFTASNEYGVFDRSAYPWLDYPNMNSQLVEPMKITILTIAGATANLNSYFEWSFGDSNNDQIEIIEDDDPDITRTRGASIVLKFLKTGIFSITVTEFDASSKRLQSYTTSAISK